MITPFHRFLLLLVNFPVKTVRCECGLEYYTTPIQEVTREGFFAGELNREEPLGWKFIEASFRFHPQVILGSSPRAYISIVKKHLSRRRRDEDVDHGDE